MNSNGWNIRILEKFFLVIATLLAVLLSFPKAFANKFNTEASSSVRALGMGNAGINIERGGNGTFYNPANIAMKDTGFNFQAINLKLGFSEGFFSQFNQNQSIDTTNLAGLYKGLSTHPNTYVGSHFSVFPNYTMRSLSFGLLYESDHGAFVNAADQSVNVRAADKFGPIAALSFRFLKGMLRVGGSIHLLTIGHSHAKIDVPYDPEALSFKKSISAGTTVEKNAGATLTFPMRYLPSFSVVVRDIGGANFSGPALVPFGTGTDTLSRPMTMDLSSSLTVYLGNKFELRNAVDLKDFANGLSGTYLQRFFMGSELTMLQWIRLRAGMMHGYFTGGFGLNNPKANIDFAIYADEIGERLRDRKDLRFTLQFTFNFFK